MTYYVTDITCDPEPPQIPTHTEYALASDDGTVVINSLEYPSLVRIQDQIVNSTMNNTLLPSNYMANLRLFKTLKIFESALFYL